MTHNININVPRLTKVCKILIIACGGIFLLQSVLGLAVGAFPFKMLLGLSTYMISNGHVYEILTYPFIGSSLIEVLFNCLMLWFIGSGLEELWGTRRFINFVAAVVIGGGAIFLLIGAIFFQSAALMSLTGMAGIVNASLLAYAIIYPDRTFTFMLLFPMKAKYFCMILIGIQLYIGVFSPGGVLAWGHLGSMLAGYLYMLWVSSRWHKSFTESGGIKKVFSKDKKSDEKMRRRNRANLKIVDDDDGDNGSQGGQGGDNDDNSPKYWH